MIPEPKQLEPLILDKTGKLFKFYDPMARQMKFGFIRKDKIKFTVAVDDFEESKKPIRNLVFTINTHGKDVSKLYERIIQAISWHIVNGRTIKTVVLSEEGFQWLGRVSEIWYTQTHSVPVETDTMLPTIFRINYE